MLEKIVYLTAEQITLIHAGVLAKSGGLFGTRSAVVLEKLATSPHQAVFGKELYPTLSHKASVYLRTIIAEHPFLDGNKRTGIMVAFTFLEVNGMRIIADDDEVFRYALAVAVEKPDIEAIAHWLSRHAKKVRAASPRGAKKR